jgi:hypothetical protein
MEIRVFWIHGKDVWRLFNDPMGNDDVMSIVHGPEIRGPGMRKLGALA